MATAGAGVVLDLTGAGRCVRSGRGARCRRRLSDRGGAGADDGGCAQGGGCAPAGRGACGIPRAQAEHPGPRLIVGLLGVEFVVWGALDILIVVLALDVLAVGAGWVGYLNAAFAGGGVVGASVALFLVGRRRLSPPIIGTMLIWGLMFVVIAAAASLGASMVLLVVAGAARAVFDVSCRTLLQRIAPAHVLGRVFGVLEGIQMLGLAVGSLLIPPLIAVGGSERRCSASGCCCPQRCCSARLAWLRSMQRLRCQSSRSRSCARCACSHRFLRPRSRGWRTPSNRSRSRPATSYCTRVTSATATTRSRTAPSR